jgi:hypothetical protein
MRRLDLSLLLRRAPDTSRAASGRMNWESHTNRPAASTDPKSGPVMLDDARHRPAARRQFRCLGQLPRALDRLDVVHAAAIPIRAKSTATRCGEMVE